jgi:hypothetical protein
MYPRCLFYYGNKKEHHSGDSAGFQQQPNHQGNLPAKSILNWNQMKGGSYASLLPRASPSQTLSIILQREVASRKIPWSCFTALNSTTMIYTKYIDVQI